VALRLDIAIITEAIAHHAGFGRAPRSNAKTNFRSRSQNSGKPSRLMPQRHCFALRKPPNHR
jgi:hypothetical protein